MLGNTRRGKNSNIFRNAQNAPGVTVGKKLTQQAVVEAVTGAKAAEMSLQQTANKVYIADAIQHFVQHELIRKAQPFLVKDGITLHHYGVIQRTATRQPLLLQPGDFMLEAESARTAEVRFKRNIRRMEYCALAGDSRIIIRDFQTH